MKNKGFTLIELLAVIIILGALSGIGVLAYRTIIYQSELRVYEAYENTMHAEAISMLTKKGTILPANGQTKRYTLTDIKVDPINNPINHQDLCPSSYVDITRSDAANVNSFTYKVCLICEDYNKDGTNCKTFDN